MESISKDEARQVALAAQGFAEPRPRTAGAEELKRVIDRLHLIQIDSVNALARAHYLPFFARLGLYRQQLLDELAYGHRYLFEQWAHAACYIRMVDYPLFHHQLTRGHDWWRGTSEERLQFFDSLLEKVREQGPVVTGEVDSGNSRQGWWNWSEAKIGLEYHFTHGRLAVRERRNFSPVYDLPERVFPAEVLALAGHEKDDAHRQMIRNSAQALGIGTLSDLRDYYRLKAAEAAPRIEELVALGELMPVRVEGWKDQAYRWHEAKAPEAALKATALLSPFDNLVWDRARTERLFGFRYRIEIYTPAPQRVYGYYVLPFLLNGQLVGRADLKANRQAKALEVKAAHLEPGAKARPAARALSKELRLMARWLGLEWVVVEPRGDLAAELAAGLGG